MKHLLRQIYDDLSHGRLSQQDALAKIRALKLAEQGGGTGTLFVSPVWEAESLPERAASIDTHYAVLCDLPAFEQDGIEIVSLRGDSQNIAQRYSGIALACFERMQAILQNRPQGTVLFQVVVPDDRGLRGLSALLKSATLENPQFIGQLVIVPASITSTELRRIVANETRGASNAVVRYAGGARQVLRWQESSVPAEPAPVAFKDHGVYLITGGLGGLGTLFTNEILATTRHAKVILTGRLPLSARTLPPQVTYQQADLTNAAQVERLMSSIEFEHGQLDGILHCAGAISDNFILRKTAEEFADVLAPKVLGTVHLDEASRDFALDFFVLFSSIAGAVGNVGQADYAAANAFLDEFATLRNDAVAAGQRSGRTRSINWPWWKSGGMALDAASRERFEQTTGLLPMDTATGLSAFHRSLALPHDQLLVLHGDRTRMRVALLSGRPIQNEARPPAPKTSAASPPLLDRETLIANTAEYLRNECADVLKLPAGKLDPQAALEKYGIDSILAMKLTTQLEKTFGTLSKTLFFEYQTLAELTQYFVESNAARLSELFSAAAGPQSPAVATPQPASATPHPTPTNRRTSRRRTSDRGPAGESGLIAIIGVSGRYPESPDLEAYWNNLRDGRDCIVEVPKSRWDWREYFTEDRTRGGHHYSKWGGFITGVDEFDPLFFNISPKEAKLIDPQERLFLQHVWMAIENAGYTRARLQAAAEDDLPGQAGVYAGVMYNEYQLLGVESTNQGHRLGIAGSAASIANRVSYFLNLHGPSITLDTMCSSSLTAIHFACQDLKLGRTQLAIAGGVNVTIHPNKYLALSAGQFISSDGHCQSFGEGGDGYIPGEGVGVVVLKRLADAERDGDNIYAVIRGSSLNHGGKTNGYTVPNPQAQATAILRALSESQTDARHVSYIEAHGTGTKLGDPIEIAALTKAFHRYTDATGFCRIGSAKSNIGHCESAAGIAGLTKVLLQMQHRQIVPSLHSAKLNPHIDFDKTPFVVNQALRAWEQPQIDGRNVPRIAGISSFGAGGSNAHVILQEYQAPERKTSATPPVAIVLSARTREQLQQKSRELLDFVRTHDVDLVAMAYTLQTGREAMDERLGFIAATMQDAADVLAAFVAGRSDARMQLGSLKRGRKEAAAAGGDTLREIVNAWVLGADVSWDALYEQPAPRRVPLPAYPFARERYWIDVTPGAKTQAVLHPLLHANTSSLHEQRFTSAFRGDEAFLTEDAGKKVLPALAALEMIRAAVEHASGKSSPLELNGITWTRPILISGAPIHVALFEGTDAELDFEIYSTDAEGEFLLCEGRAAILTGSVSPNTPFALDLAVLESIEQSGSAAALESMRILAPFTREATIAIRNNGTRIDADVRDASGLICAELRGLTLHARALSAPQPAQVEAPQVAVTPVRVERKKPGAIALPAPAGIAPATRSAARTLITLSSTASLSAEPLRVSERGDGIVSIDAASSATLEQLRRALDRVHDNTSARVLIVRGAERCFARGREAFHQALALKIFETAASFPIPIIAATDSDAIGAGFLFAALCDFVVLDEAAHYGFTDPANGLYPTLAETTLFRARFGDALGEHLLYNTPIATGTALRAKGWTSPVVPAASIDAHVQALATSLASKSRDALRLLKEHLTRGVRNAVLSLKPAEAAADCGTKDDVVVLSDAQSLHASHTARAIVLTGDALRGDAARAILNARIPVVAALTGDANGEAWSTALLCDAVVYAADAMYSAAGLPQNGAAVFAHRLGIEAANEVLLTGTAYSGDELRRRAGTAMVVDRDGVLQAAMDIAERWAAFPRAALTAWKEQSAAILQQKLREITVHERDGEPIAAPVAIPLRSTVVTATAHPGGIVLVKLEDREAKNMFSDAFMEGVEEIFAHVESSASYKVVILTGYDQYFASGGTKESLLAIQAGKVKFTDSRVFQLPMQCSLPVIAAMQGHGIGAGWCLGMFSDIVLSSEESRYVSPYVNYGFTPGAGATWILPYKLGHDLARESMMTGEAFTGSALRERNASIAVLPRAEVEMAAMEVAGRLARQPRQRLIALKRQLAGGTAETLSETLRRELAMHEQTFVGRADTLAQIETNFIEEAAPQELHEASAPSSGDDLLPEVHATLRTLLASELQLRESDVDDHTQFIDLGLDSISGVSWIRKINEKYKTAIEATKVYSYPTLAQLSRHVKDEAEKAGVLVASAPATPSVVVPQPAPVALLSTPRVEMRKPRRKRDRVIAPSAQRAPQRIAVIGMAGQFPQARNLDEFWQNLAAGKNCITRVSPERWDVNRYYQPGEAVPGKTNSQWLGALDDYDRFDPLFFNISPTEAELMDPQHRLFLEACWHGIEDAGYDAKSLSGTKTGVFVGCATGDYHQLSRRSALSAQGFTGNATSILAARISYFLNLQGPCVSIDTACSSSLVAIAQACDSLNAGASDLALAGGVYVMAGPDMHIRTAQAAMLSPDGRCFTFDQRANGFVPGEGAGVVVLKRLADAERDRDAILGVIDAWGVNQDGRTNGITAPNPESQTRLMQDVHAKYGIDPAHIQLIEAHGTGTKLGDPIEVEGLKAAFRTAPKSGYCAIGSVKSNIGHCLTAAGIAGVIKLLLALKHRKLPPTIHFERLNEHIDLSGSPFFVNTQLQEWPLHDAPRRQAAVSSFGFSGTNAHLVIGEFIPPVEVQQPPVRNRRTIVPLSARTPEQLRRKVADLLAHVRNEAASFADVAYTLQTGRMAMDERCAFVVESLEQLTAVLDAHLRGELAAGHQGNARRKKDALASAPPISDENLDALAGAWVNGRDIDWNALWRDAKPNRVRLPLYPFAKERYWVEAESDAPAAMLHPLLHRNTSSLSEHRYSSTFRGDEPFLAGGALTPAAYLEMARAAAELAMPHRSAELRNVTWSGEAVVNGATDVHVALFARGTQQLDFETYSGDVVHCQGSAVMHDAQAVTSAEVVLDSRAFDALDPVLGDRTPFAIDSVRFIARPSDTLAAAVRKTFDTKFDIDLIDGSGTLCVELRGLSARTMESMESMESASATILAAPVWREMQEAGTASYAERHVLACGLSIPDAIAIDSASADPGRRYSEYAVACFERIQEIVRRKPQQKVLVQIVVDDERFVGLSGLLKTAALESPQIAGQLLVVENAGDAGAEAQYAFEPVVKYASGARYVQRWDEIEAHDAVLSPYKDDGVYLITGGRGGLGTLFANAILARTRNAHVVVTGRSETLDPPRDPRIHYRRLDLRNLEEVRHCVDAIRDEFGAITGVLHCAGMTSDDVIASKSPAEFRAVLAPKVEGTLHLDDATKDLPLDFFVLFSSIASALGNAGQADYAVANGFMDRFAAHRNALVSKGERRGKTRSIHWPLWQDGGMAIDPATLELLQQTLGVAPLPAADGLTAFDRSLALPHDELLVVAGDRQKITAHLRKARMFDAPATQEQATGTVAMTAAQVQQQLKTLLAAVVKLDASRIDADQPFGELGLDSFLGAELVVAINKKFGTELSHLRLFDYATVREFSRFLEQELQKIPAATPVARRSSAAFPVLRKSNRSQRKVYADDKIAIIGMSGRYPKAKDLREYWNNLAAGLNAVTEVPRWRWDVDRYYDADRNKKDKTYSKWLGAVGDIECFDPLFFRISPQEAEYMDPQHRLFLQESYRAFEDAGYSPSALSNRKCGVYLGISTNEYMTLLSRHGVLAAPVTSNSSAIAAARIAYYLNLKGPAISVDTACSSSLVAIHLACQAIQNGEIDMAIAGGVSLWLTPDSYVAMSKAGMFSPDGQCKTFDDSANGIVNGEGIGAVVLKRLRNAEADGDAIYSVILGSGINQDGRTSGITAPSVNSQIELERSLYEKFDIDPETITCVEAHGTGTKLGDPIELEALATVFKEKTQKKNFCALGSVKSNLGHTTSAAGVAGLHKILLSMRHRTLVPTLNFTKGNAKFDFENSPFYISRETKPWDVAPGTLRRAAVSSFGFSGTNAHLVVEEYSGSEPAGHHTGEAVIVPLSARTPDALRQKVADLAQFLRAETPDLACIAFTLQTGREAMEERLGFIAASIEELTQKLDAWLHGERGIDGVHQGRVEPGNDSMTFIGRDEEMQETIDRWIERRKLAPLLDLWIRGVDLDWSRLYGAWKPRRVSLPAYPFAKERCWIDGAIAAPPRETETPIEVDLKSIENIIEQIDADAIETEEAIHALRMLV
jgi:acyl transferase domain-containing protein/enoyl-CoA hydratase/carnithine racemase/acyl carrier protein/NADP-dependent 3-hydroxy acid dehydrogenase YdfG